MWAEALAAGIDDDTYWQCTPQETRLLFEAFGRRQSQLARAETLRAGLIAAAIYNVNRRRGTPVITPEDFLPRDQVTVSPEVAVSMFREWAQGINAARRPRMVQ
jgi:hypothetical protein